MPETASLDHDERLALLVADLTERFRSGEQVELEAVTREHPDLADDLRFVWPAVLIAEEVARPATPSLAATILSLEAQKPPASSGPLPRTFGDYELLDELGRGGMGVVYKARQHSLGRTVALKMILNADVASPSELGRFRSEAKAAARLDHPHIVPVYETGECEGRPYFSMKYIDGPTLAELATPNPLPSRQAAQYVLKVAEAVQHAHDAGILHRDLKPSNVIVDRDGEPHVSDFGLAKRVPALPVDGARTQAPADVSVKTQSGTIMGTPSYMPPEQAVGNRGAFTPAGDVYSLGAILYYLLTGRPPFLAASSFDILMQVLEQDPLPPRLLNPNVDRDLETICLKCLQKPPELRYSSASELAGDLRAYLNGEPISVRPGTFAHFVSRMLRPTHHAPVLENWGTLWMAHSVKVLIQCGLTAWVAWIGFTGKSFGDRVPYLLLWGVALLLWSWIFWSIRKRSGPITFIERQVAHVWGASVIASILLFFVEMLMDLPVLTLSPVLALIAGIIFFTKAGMLSGSLYIPAFACFITALIMACVPPPVGILIFGFVISASFGVPGWTYYRQRQRALR